MTRKMMILIAAAAAIVPTASMAAPNPASVFCGKMGGKTVIAKLQSGDEIGLCYLAKDRIVEEWTLFHMFKGKKPKNSQNPFLAK